MPDRLSAAIRRAERQYGLLTHDQALELGFSTSAVHRLVAKGTWDRPLPRVFRLWKLTDEWRQMVQALGFWGGDGATISHRSAAALWGFDLCPRGQLEVTLTSPRKAPLPVIHVHRLPIPASDRGLLEGIWVTTPTRTLLDLASVSDSEHLEAILHSAIRERRTSLARLRSMLDRNGSRHGATRLMHLIDDLSRNGPTESILEIRFLQLLDEVGYLFQGGNTRFSKGPPLSLVLTSRIPKRRLLSNSMATGSIRPAANWNVIIADSICCSRPGGSPSSSRPRTSVTRPPCWTGCARLWVRDVCA